MNKEIIKSWNQKIENIESFYKETNKKYPTLSCDIHETAGKFSGIYKIILYKITGVKS